MARLFTTCPGLNFSQWLWHRSGSSSSRRTAKIYKLHSLTRQILYSERHDSSPWILESGIAVVTDGERKLRRFEHHMTNVHQVFWFFIWFGITWKSANELGWPRTSAQCFGLMLNFGSDALYQLPTAASFVPYVRHGSYFKNSGFGYGISFGPLAF